MNHEFLGSIEDFSVVPTEEELNFKIDRLYRRIRNITNRPTELERRGCLTESELTDILLGRVATLQDKLEKYYGGSE
jgi:hypothetical protein